MSLADRFRLVWTPFLKKERGKVRQAVGLICPPVLGSGGDLTLHVGKRKLSARKIDLIRYPADGMDQNNESVYLWLIPRPARPVRIRATWKTPLGSTHRDALRLTPADPSNVHVIFKTHIDLGYTARFEEVIRDYQTRLMVRLLDNLDATADREPGHRFVWTLSTWLLEQCLDPKHVAAEHRRRLEGHIRSGQVAWGLMPFTTHSEFFGREEMCRSIYAARRLAERFGVPVPAAAKMTDVPAHTASLAMAFAAAGGRFFQIGTNPDCLPPRVPPLFWWKLPDEQQILCHYHGTYGTPLLPPADWPWREWLSIQITSDNVGPQGLDLVNHLQWIDAHFDSPVCRTGRLEDFADAAIRRHGRELPVVEKEFTDWWIHGIASQSQPTGLARRAKDRLPSAEALRTLAAWASGQPVPEKEREQARAAYEQLALYTEHTWGDHAADARKALPKGNRYTSPVFAGRSTPPPVDRWVASWEDKAAFARQAHQMTDRIDTAARGAFARAVSRGGGAQPAILVFNSLSWARGGLVRIKDRKLPSGAFELVDPTTGGAVVYERRQGWIEFIAPPVPPCGYLALEIRPVARPHRPGGRAAWDPRGLTLHSDDYALMFHEKGGLARWHDRARSCQWCSDEAEFPLGSYVYEMPGGERMRAFARQVHTNCWAQTTGYFNRHEYERMSDFGPVGGGPARITAEVNPLYARVIVEAKCPTRKVPNRRSGNARAYRSTFTAYHGQRDLHLTLDLLGKQPTYGAEAGYACFPFAGEEPFVFVDRIAHLLDPGGELAGQVNAAHMAVHHGVRVEGQHTGINLYPLDTPLMSFEEPGTYRFDPDGDYKTGLLYATLFNNGWGTNFAQWQSGDLSFGFVLRPTANDDWDGGLARGGAEVFRPLAAEVVQGWRGDASRSLLGIDSSCVQLVALKSADFERGTVMRLWNADVDPADARITLPAMQRGDRLWRCDLLERRKGKAIAISTEGEATVRLGPHEIATLLLQPGDRTGGAPTKV